MTCTVLSEQTDPYRSSSRPQSSAFQNDHLVSSLSVHLDRRLQRYRVVDVVHQAALRRAEPYYQMTILHASITLLPSTIVTPVLVESMKYIRPLLIAFASQVRSLTSEHDRRIECHQPRRGRPFYQDRDNFSLIHG